MEEAVKWMKQKAAIRTFYSAGDKLGAALSIYMEK